MSDVADLARQALCTALERYTPRTWWQAILRSLLLRACMRHTGIPR